ncbi:hypothetical protein SAMD00019534_082790, partial [Acytostelium subglobosum LB1]|uniref:hypothetical protein n=1 Tax=Acytostelium subglobosum LB1 TaxID=1410327 RepID=UPI0006449E6E
MDKSDAKDMTMMEKKKIDKLNKLTGRRDSIAKISSLLNPRTPEEAKLCSQKLETNEKLTNIFGQRPQCS